MALLMNTDEGYTQTGNGRLTRWANGLSLLPSWFPGRGLFVSVMSYGDTIIEAAQYLFRGQFGSAATVAASGTVSTMVNLASEGPLWWLNVGSTALTGATLGTHARKLTEGAIGVGTGVLGMKPTVLRSYTAGIGSVGTSMPAPPAGRFTTQIANERGQDANAYYQQKMAGDAGAYVSPSLTGQQAIG